MKFGLNQKFWFKKSFEPYRQTLVRVIMKVAENFVHFGINESEQNSANFLTNFSSQFSKI
jgi:hypothetical protein